MTLLTCHTDNPRTMAASHPTSFPSPTWFSTISLLCSFWFNVTLSMG